MLIDASASGPADGSLHGSHADHARLVTSDVEALERALARARRWLTERQHRDGYWVGELQTNVTMDAEDLLLRELLGLRDAELIRKSAAYIRRKQREDGSWSNAAAGPADPSTTVEAYVALRLAGDREDAPHMLRAAAYVRSAGGIDATRVFTRIWLAMFGLWSWDALPVLPPEMIALPPWVPLNVYDFACWARQTVVALSVVMTYRPVRPIRLDDGTALSLEELRARGAARKDDAPVPWLSRVFGALDGGLRLYGRRPIATLRERALAEAERWIVRRQEADGSWGGIQPPWVYSLIALHLRGYPLDHPVMRVGLEGLDRFTVHDDGERRLEACQSPVWDTALAVQALHEAGEPAGAPSLVRGADWLLRQQVRVPGDWSVRRPELEPGGWAFEFANVNYPDIDDSAEVMLALRSAGHPRPRDIETAIALGVRWVLGMQSADGGWGAFDADNTRALCRHIPFCDFGEVIDEPSADVTAHAVELLCREGLTMHSATRAGVRWLLAHQESDGSWFGRWGINHVYGTGAVLVALAAAEEPHGSEASTRGVAWLLAHQNADGGWGEDVRSYDDVAWRGRGDSTPSQTAWSLMGLVAARADLDPEGRRAIERGTAHLVSTQREDGGWDEARYTGTGFPGDFYINYHLYRDVFPTTALGRVARLFGVLEDPRPVGVVDVPLDRLRQGAT
ncbi:MAG: squalene--hopene cyclase [Sandaracinaceae bacterium]